MDKIGRQTEAENENGGLRRHDAAARADRRRFGPELARQEDIDRIRQFVAVECENREERAPDQKGQEKVPMRDPGRAVEIERRREQMARKPAKRSKPAG